MSEPYFNKITAAGYHEIENEIEALKAKRPALTKRLAAAAALGDRSENVEIGKKITIEFVEDHDQMTYQLVGKQEADIKTNKISLVSPLGSALLNKTVDDVVTVNAPDETYQVKIISVNL